MDQSPQVTKAGMVTRVVSTCASNKDGRFGPGLLGVGIALVLVKLWLVSAQRIYAIGFAQYDDALFLRLADYLVKGQWLGPYDYLTLAKGPMYPLFIAATYELHIPLFTAQQLLYSGACVLFVTAIRPLVSRRAMRFTLFAVLLFNPVTYDTVIHARVLRQLAIAASDLEHRSICGNKKVVAVREQPPVGSGSRCKHRVWRIIEC